ncbi:hypothetical protein JOB18_013907 [Solea senegalensis]|uniref:Uncharacterized protein n=1 Tax=Solea senegalensis TaxID=28829 RepID=A0AAV6PVZ6_SOLSE|nr:hypothetical protein JOB18_013907 [Solea senegalensis]
MWSFCVFLDTLLEFSSCVEVTTPLCKSTLCSSRALCSAAGSLRSARPRKHQRLSGKLLDNKTVVDLKKPEEKEGGRISLDSPSDKEPTLCGGHGECYRSDVENMPCDRCQYSKDAYMHYSILFPMHPLALQRHYSTGWQLTK